MNSPFKFLDAYEKKDKDIFFGRNEEIEILYNNTFKTNLMLVYGQSGTGKTSLIQCGLANRFRETDWFDIYIRRGDDINVSLRRRIREKADTPIEESADVPEAIQSLYLDFLKPIYLIFDQFEELFILGTKEEQQAFFNTIVRLLNSSNGTGRKRISCKIIFAMREEYIAWLYDF
ncbi:MAG: ATP-binding protein, partial [Candidatus Aminicenantes bacterium]